MRTVNKHSKEERNKIEVSYKQEETQTCDMENKSHLLCETIVKQRELREQKMLENMRLRKELEAVQENQQRSESRRQELDELHDKAVKEIKSEAMKDACEYVQRQIEKRVT